MQNLKRFAQCGSLTMLFLVFIVLIGDSSTALTTFGKARPSVPPVKGRECHTHFDCSSLPYTSCVKNLDDEKPRCLCGDNKAPVNGLCKVILASANANESYDRCLQRVCGPPCTSSQSACFNCLDIDAPLQC